MRAPRLGPQSLVVELASNDGYLLQYFVKGDPVLGIEPAANVAEGGIREGRPDAGQVLREGDWRVEVAADGPAGGSASGQQRPGPGARSQRLRGGDHGPAEASDVITIEFPHLLRLMEENQFDTIYHEHFSYFSLIAAEKDLRRPRPDDLRRRGDADAWRIAPGLCRRHGMTRAAPFASASGDCAREEAAGYKGSGFLHASGSRCGDRSGSCWRC